ncbi:hypothetical protein [Glutamicibacter arilaitensis]|uniref:hypothetical protein n=1 Tax=Glutamicibacter arilaitensis TaxID=256701 RepID=UPI00384D961D
MRYRSLPGLAALVCAVLLVPATPAIANSSDSADSAYTFGVIGDIPYGAAQLAEFPSMVSELNEQDELRFIAHVGDIKAGSEQCTDERLGLVKEELDRLRTPLVFTPGDNEWVDCHRANNGAYNPLERLDTLREMFFPVVNKTLGGTMQVDSQADIGLPENVQFTKNRVAFSVVNLQGSNNSLAPWTGLGLTEPTSEQLEEVALRTEANLDQLNETFAKAKRSHARAVVVMTQADMFTPGFEDESLDNPESVSGFKPFVEALASESKAFGGPVYLVNGDSHVFNQDAPLAAGSPWLEVYDVAPVPNLQRVTVEGAATSKEWLRVSIAPNSAEAEGVLSWERVPFTS